jgi:hypothetical protein
MTMQRREFIAGLGSAAALSLVQTKPKHFQCGEQSRAVEGKISLVKGL